MTSHKIPTTNDTDFAPAARADESVLQAQASTLSGSDYVRALDVVGVMVLVLNEQRQVVYANRRVLALLPDAGKPEVFGMRPGEALGCVNADKHESGCGTSKWCRDCGAARAMLECLTSGSDVQECHIVRHRDDRLETLDLLVVAETLDLAGGDRFMVITLLDISHEKRRQALEQVFFHDLLNLAGGLESLVEEFSASLGGNNSHVAPVLKRGFNQLVEEIKSQKVLTQAENRELICCFDKLDSGVLLDSVADIYRTHRAGRGRTVEVDPKAWRGRMVSDEGLLSRVLGNLVKNALEAVDQGQTVTLGCDRTDSEVRFWVRNPGVMPEEVQRQIFTRSFSTKGAGRGLGTYGVQLLTESCLNGRVGFEASESDGILFHVSLPL